MNQNKLIQSKEINALQMMNLERDKKGINTVSTKSGGIKTEQVFENYGTEIISEKTGRITISTTSRQLLDYCRSKATEQITHKTTDLNKLDKQRKVSLTVEEIAVLFYGGASKNAKKEARRIMNVFYEETRDIKLTVSYKVRDGKKLKICVGAANIFDADIQETVFEENSAGVGLIESLNIMCDGSTGSLLKRSNSAIKNGKMTLQFSMDFARHLAQSPSEMKHNNNGYLIDRRKYKAAYGLQYKLEVHEYMNRNHKNKDVITLGNLLKDCYELPTIDNVRNGNRNFTERIKTPLIANIQALLDYGILKKYCYLDSNGCRITTTELMKMDIEEFVKCKLCFLLTLHGEEN